MELVFVRHGQPRWSVDGIAQPDPALTDVGRRQAELVARRLAEERPIAEILVSPAIRAIETAAPLVELTGAAPTLVDDLAEIQMPDWTGQPDETVQRIFVDARDRPPSQWWEGIPGGESFDDFHRRITTTLDRLLADRGVVGDPDHPHLWRAGPDPGRIVVVAHAGTNAVSLGHLLGAEPTPWEWDRFIMYHASLARIRTIPLAGEHVFSLRTLNDREHLPRVLRTR